MPSAFRRRSSALLAGALLSACVHLSRPPVAPPPPPGPAPADGALPFRMVLDSHLAAVDPALFARLEGLDVRGDHDGVFTRGDAWAAGEGTQLFADLHIHPFMNDALPFFVGGLDATRVARSPSTFLRTQVTLPLLRRGAGNVLFASVYVDAVHVTARGRLRTALRQIDQAKRFAAAHADAVEIAGSAADVRRIVASRKIAVVLCVEGGHVISRVEDVDRLRDAGVRMITLVHFTNNALAGAAFSTLSHPENFHYFGKHRRDDGVAVNRRGLTPFGRAVIARMAADGILVDLAHASDATVRDVLDATAADPIPLIISHTAMRAYHPAERNEPDALLRDVAARGGVVGLSSWRVELDAKGLDECEAFAAHFRRLLDLVGPEHVGIGTDFNGLVMRPRACPRGGTGIGATGLRNEGDMPALYQQLADEGVPPRVLESMGENMLRAMETMESRRHEKGSGS